METLYLMMKWEDDQRTSFTYRVSDKTVEDFVSVDRLIAETNAKEGAGVKFPKWLWTLPNGIPRHSYNTSYAYCLIEDWTDGSLLELDQYIWDGTFRDNSWDTWIPTLNIPCYVDKIGDKWLAYFLGSGEKHEVGEFPEFEQAARAAIDAARRSKQARELLAEVTRLVIC